MFTMSIYVFGISGVLFHVGNNVLENHSVFVDYKVKNGHIDPKISKTIQHSEIFLSDTNGPLSSN